MSRGENVNRVSSEWFSRPDDERYLSLDDLFASVKGRAERSRTRTVESAAIRVEAHRDNPEKLGLVLPGGDEPIAPTHWSFGQLSRLVGAPAACLRQLPAPLAGINLQYGLPPTGARNHRSYGPKANHALKIKMDHSGGADQFPSRAFDILTHFCCNKLKFNKVTVRAKLGSKPPFTRGTAFAI